MFLVLPWARRLNDGDVSADRPCDEVGRQFSFLNDFSDSEIAEDFHEIQKDLLCGMRLASVCGFMVGDEGSGRLRC